MRTRTLTGLTVYAVVFLMLLCYLFLEGMLRNY
jgi:hypothetical protein